MDGVTGWSMSTVKDALNSRRDLGSHGSFQLNSASLFVDVTCET